MYDIIVFRIEVMYTPNLYFTICALFISALLMIIFFSKKKIKNIDNQLYSFLLIFNFLDCLFMTIVILIGYGKIGDFENQFLAKNLNKVDFIMYIMWAWTLFIYTMNVVGMEIKFIKRVAMLTLISNIITIILMFGLPIELYKSSKSLYCFGPALNCIYIACAIYTILILFTLLFNFKRILSKKLLPIYFMGLFLILALIVNKTNPGLLVIPAMVSYIDLIMYFTIENPDLKMVNELELAKNQAEKANRAKTDFLSSMSHEIRTPLNAIVGLSNVIKDSDDLEEIHEDASDVVNASNTLLEIVNGILDISRIEADKMEVIECNYSPLEEFKTLVILAETRIGEKDIELRTKFAEDLPEVLYGDKGKVKQIITNLLTNAVKYTENGYIDFKVNCVNEDNISRLTITVKDTGRGIKKEKFDTLFTKFNRLEEDRNSTIEGTGLGLVITKALVEMMGGKIVVDSTYGEGSKFTIFLSQKIGNASNIEIVKDELNTFDGKKVLVVDDNKLNIKVVNKILKEFDLDIDSCESGFECLEKINNGNSYDLILMDIMMPKMGGVETFKKLKQIDNFNTPVVALTADAIEGKANKYLEVGFNAYLSKPIDKLELNKVLDNILNNKQEEEEKEDPEVNKVIPITDDDIEMLNKLINKE